MRDWNKIEEYRRKNSFSFLHDPHQPIHTDGMGWRIIYCKKYKNSPSRHRRWMETVILHNELEKIRKEASKRNGKN